MGQETRAKTISFMSAKGGVGKTSIAVNIANFCAYYKMKVLLVDCDFRTKGATHFLEISKISLKEGSFITLQGIIEDILSQNMNLGSDDKNEADVNKKEPMVQVSENLAFISATRQKFDAINTIVSRISNVQSNHDSNKDSGWFADFEKSLCKKFETFKKEYELILLDLGAGSDSISGIFSRMSDCICVVAEDDIVSLMSVREMKKELYQSNHIVPCYNKINEKNKDCQYDKDFLFDPIRGFEYMADYAELFNNGEWFNLEEDKHASTLMTIIKGLGVDTKKIEEEKQKQESKKLQKEQREQKKKEKTEKLKRQEEERKQEEKRKQEEQKRQEEERRQEERKKCEERDKLMNMEYRRMDKWNDIICTGILFSLLLVISFFVNYWNRVTVWVYGLANIFLIILLISCFGWLSYFRMKIEEIIKHAYSSEKVLGEETNDENQ